MGDSIVPLGTVLSQIESMLDKGFSIIKLGRYFAVCKMNEDSSFEKSGMMFSEEVVNELYDSSLIDINIVNGRTFVLSKLDEV